MRGGGRLGRIRGNEAGVSKDAVTPQCRSNTYERREERNNCAEGASDHSVVLRVSARNGKFPGNGCLLEDSCMAWNGLPLVPHHT